MVPDDFSCNICAFKGKCSEESLYRNLINHMDNLLEIIDNTIDLEHDFFVDIDFTTKCNNFVIDNTVDKKGGFILLVETFD